MNEPQIIEKDGKPQYAIVPWEEWRALQDRLELLEDSRAFAGIKARDTEFLPADVAKAVFAGNNPIGVYRRYRRLTQSQAGGKNRRGQADDFFRRIRPAAGFHRSSPKDRRRARR